MKKVFDWFYPQRHAEDPEARWGDTEAYRVAAERTKAYTKEDWNRVHEEQAAIYVDAAKLLADDQSPDSGLALAIAERHRLSIDRWFYPCSLEVHVGLADLYENDQHYAASIDRYGAGLAKFLVAAIRANARA